MVSACSKQQHVLPNVAAKRHIKEDIKPIPGIKEMLLAMKRICPTTSVRICRFTFVLAFVLLFLATTGHTLDFYGALVSDRELPSSFFKIHMYGFRPIVDRITSDSPADKFGLRQGDVILSINGKSVARTSDFSAMTEAKNDIRVIRGLTRKRITVNGATIEAAQQVRHAANKAQETTPKASTPPSSDNSPAIRFDDADLEKRFGKTTPAQREALRQQNQHRVQQEEADASVRKQRLLQEEQQQAEAKAAAEVARKQQEAQEEQRKAAEREAAKRQWEANQRAQAELVRQQQLNDMQEKIDRLERDRAKRSAEIK
jgi:hypothetical protein